MLIPEDDFIVFPFKTSKENTKLFLSIMPTVRLATTEDEIGTATILVESLHNNLDNIWITSSDHELAFVSSCAMNIFGIQTPTMVLFCKYYGGSKSSRLLL